MLSSKYLSATENTTVNVFAVLFISASEYMYVYSGLNTIAVAKDEKIAFGDELGTIGIDSISGKHQMNLMVFKNGEAVERLVGLMPKSSIITNVEKHI